MYQYIKVKKAECIGVYVFIQIVSDSGSTVHISRLEVRFDVARYSIGESKSVKHLHG